MKLRHLFIHSLLLAASGSLSSAAIVTSFGTSSSFITDQYNDFATSQTADRINLTGTGQSTFSGTFDAVNLLDSYTLGLNLSGELTTLANAPFSLRLYDGSDSAYATYVGGSWAALNQSGVISLTYDSETSGFDATQVRALELVQSGGVDTLEVSLFSLSAVPEPGTYAIFMGLGVLVCVWCKRKESNA